MQRLDLVYFDAGGGHRSSAYALADAIRRQEIFWKCRMVNLQEALDPIDLVKRTSGVRMQDLYNFALRRGWTVGSAEMIRLLHFLLRLTHPAQVKLLSEVWRAGRPDLVVSLIPHFNRAIYESLNRAQSKARLVTILTDLADYPPHFWIEKQSQFVICGSDRAAQQAGQIGYPECQIRRVSGMILHPDFYDTAAIDRAAERRRFGLDPAKPTGIVLFGGHGCSAMKTIAGRLQKAGAPVQLILMCGRNERLAGELHSLRGPVPMLVQPFTRDVARYMRLADFFIGKPGPGSISEALAMGLPVIVERSARTMVQERYNVDWILERGVGLAVTSFSRIDRAVADLLAPARLATLHANIAAVENRAVFEIVGILGEIFEPGRSPAAPPVPATGPGC